MRGTNRDNLLPSVGNLAHALFTARFLALPLKEDPTSQGPGLTAQEIYEGQANIFQYVFLDFDPAKSYKHRALASRDAEMLGDIMRKVVEGARRRPGPIERLMGRLHPSSSDVPAMPGFGKDLVLRFSEGGKSVEDVVWELVPTQAAAAATQSAAVSRECFSLSPSCVLGQITKRFSHFFNQWAQLIDVYMSDKYKNHWPAIVALAQSDSPEAFEILRKYTLEG